MYRGQKPLNPLALSFLFLLYTNTHTHMPGMAIIMPHDVLMLWHQKGPHNSYTFPTPLPNKTNHTAELEAMWYERDSNGSIHSYERGIKVTAYSLLESKVYGAFDASLIPHCFLTSFVLCEPTTTDCLQLRRYCPV